MLTLELAILILNYSCVPIAVLGFVGNLLMLVVFSQHTLRKLTVSAYFRASALINLYINLNLIKIFASLQLNYVLRNQSRFLCKSVMFFIYATGAMSAWYLVAAGIDRLVTIVYPNRFAFMHRTHTPLVIIAILSVYNFFYYFHMWFTYDLILVPVDYSDYSDYSDSSSDSFPNFHDLSNSSTIDDSLNTTNSSSPLYVYDCLANFQGNGFDVSDLVNTAVVPFLIMLASTLATIKGNFSDCLE